VNKNELISYNDNFDESLEATLIFLLRKRPLFFNKAPLTFKWLLVAK